MHAARLALTLTIVGAAVSACGRGDPILMNIAANRDGPDEFAVLPTEPLEIPDDVATLPEPTPGGRNRVDPDPEAQAIAALGGNPGRAQGASAALMAHATRFGIEAGIRQTLAAEDLAFRERNDGLFFERVFNINIYPREYQALALDQDAELERLRAAGVRTPGAPPEGRQ